MNNKRKIIIGNCDAWGESQLSRSNPKKSAFYSLRWLSYAESSQDVVVCHSDFSPEYLEYRKAILGFIPHTFSPKEFAGVSNLTAKSSADTGMLKKIKSLIAEGSVSVQLQFAVVTEGAKEISRTLDLPITTPGIDKIEDGSVDYLNSKVEFIRRCETLGFATPGGLVAIGYEQIAEAAKSILENCNSIMLRKAQGASCMGIRPFSQVKFEDFCSQLKMLDSSWFEDFILVEPLLPLVSSPCTLGFISEDQKSHLVLSGDQLFAQSAYCWISPPTCPSHLIKQMENWFLTYTDFIARESATGWLDIDWGITVDHQLVGIESNYRMTGWTAMAQLLRSLFGADRTSYPCFFSSDVLPLRKEYSLHSVFSKLDQQSKLFKKGGRAGVFITSPPNDEYIGLAIFGDNYSDIFEVIKSISWISPTFDEFELKENIITTRVSP